MSASGITTINFGAFPGGSDGSVVVTGQAGIVSGSLVEAWIRPEATADHTADEHMVETIKIFAHSIVEGVGFTISGFNTNQVNEPLIPTKGVSRTTTAAENATSSPHNFQQQTAGGLGTLVYGEWTVAWVWS